MTRKKAAPVLPARAHPTPRGGDREAVVHAALPLLAADEEDPWARALSRIRTIPDFPGPGSTYRDITPLLADPVALHMVLDALAHRFIGARIDVVVGLESRGFIFGGAMAARLNAGFVPIRRAGRLPGKTDRVSYSQEYGELELEMQRDALSKGQKVLVVDDLLVTGATAAAACELVERQDADVTALGFVLELVGSGGRERLEGRSIISVLRVD